MSVVGHSRPGPAGRRSSHVRYAPKATFGQFCEAFGCSHVSGLFSNGRVTSIAMQPLWLLALM
jgi:hypothetical protein